MKQGDKLYKTFHKSDPWDKPQSSYIGMSEAQIQELVKTGRFDDIPTGRKQSMSGRRVYGYESATWERGWPSWNYVGKWLRKRVGQPKEKIETEFIDLWKKSKMSNCDYGPLEYLNRHHNIDEREQEGNWRRGYYWDENNILRMYKPRLYKNQWPDYNTLEKRRANKEVYSLNKEKISGNGPIGVGAYFIDEDRGKELHHCVAIKTDVWNQGLPKNQQYPPSEVWRWDKVDQTFVDYLHREYKPVHILGVGSETVKVVGNYSVLWKNDIRRYMFATPKQ
jgi:hypothetical protein